MIDVPREDIIVMLEAGYIYLAMKKFKEAKHIFEGICELAPKHEVPRVGVANVFFAQGKYLEAIRILKKTITDNPDSAFAYAHLGEAQLFYGKRKEAQSNLTKASELDSGDDGKSGEFARSLLGLMDMGYDPREFKKVFKQFAQDHEKKKQETTSE
ncbi:MAG: tetratricopeptide repeat protein [bacterium]|nr:tetratricopeptide repeat protein [bacterium]MBU1917122.1 tetratricopeptide repeat protein [bacterium]